MSKATKETLSRPRSCPLSRWRQRAGVRVALGWLALLIAFAASPAQAGPLFELTGGDLGVGGFNARVAGASPASTYFNPALLPFADPAFQLGLFILSDQISIDLDARRRAQADVPEGVSSYAHPDGAPLTPTPLPTKWLEKGIDEPGLKRDAHPRQGESNSGQTRTYSVIGLVTRAYDKYLALGLHAAIPLGGFTAASAFYNDEREQFFSNSLYPELYSDRLDAAELAFGAGSRVLDKLSIGMSFTLSLKNSAVTPVYVPDAAKLNEVLIDADIHVTTAVSPHFGLVFDPTPRLRIAATLHTVQSMQVKTDFTYLLNSGGEQGSSVVFNYGYVPWSIGLGASFDLIEPPPHSPQNHELSLVGSALFSNWNLYRDRHNERPAEAYAWSQTITPSLGIRHSYAAWRSFLDLTYAPSPVPAQTGRSNYVDNDRVGMSGGFDYTFALVGASLRAGLQLQVHGLLSRGQKKLDPNDPANDDKDPKSLVLDEVPDDAIDNATGGQAAKGRKGLQTNNPGWPGFKSEGWILGGGAYLALLF